MPIMSVTEPVERVLVPRGWLKLTQASSDARHIAL
jgi:hypothetical protein